MSFVLTFRLEYKCHLSVTPTGILIDNKGLKLSTLIALIKCHLALGMPNFRNFGNRKDATRKSVSFRKIW